MSSHFNNTSWYQHLVRPDRCIGMFESVAINSATTNHSDTRYHRSEPAARHWTCFLECEVTTTCYSAALALCVWAVVWWQCNCSPLVLSNILSNLPSKQLTSGALNSRPRSTPGPAKKAYVDSWLHEHRWRHVVVIRIERQTKCQTSIQNKDLTFLV